MFRLKVKRSWMSKPGFVIGTLQELQALAALPDCTVLPDPYNPPGFPQDPAPIPPEVTFAELLQMVIDECEVLNPDGTPRPLPPEFVDRIRAALKPMMANEAG